MTTPAHHLSLLLLGLLLAVLVNGTADPYHVLGIARDASQAQVRRAYRRLSLANHPDKVPPGRREQAKLDFDAISDAYETLSDPDKRRG